MSQGDRKGLLEDGGMVNEQLCLARSERLKDRGDVVVWHGGSSYPRW